MMSETDFSFRLALFGDPDVGKQTLLKTMAVKPISLNGLEYFVAETNHTIQKKKVILEIFPINDKQNMNQTLRYHAALILYDMTDLSSFEHLQRYIDEFKQIGNVGSQIFVIGTKVDLNPDNAKLATLPYHQYKISTENRSSVIHLITEVTKNLLNDYQNEYMSICKEITQELFDHPSSIYFRYPVDPAEYPNYLEIVKNPQDLSKILDKLDNNQYQSIEDWQRDIKQIGINSELFNGKDTILQLYFDEMMYVYNALLEKLPPIGMKKLSVELNAKIKDFNTECDAAPPEIREMFPDGLVYTQSDIKLPFIGKDISHLIEGIEEIEKSADTSLQLNQIVNEFDIKKIDNGNFTDIEIDNIFDDAKIYLRSFVNLHSKKQKK